MSVEQVCLRKNWVSILGSIFVAWDMHKIPCFKASWGPLLRVFTKLLVWEIFKVPYVGASWSTLLWNFTKTLACMLHKAPYIEALQKCSLGALWRFLFGSFMKTLAWVPCKAPYLGLLVGTWNCHLPPVLAIVHVNCWRYAVALQQDCHWSWNG